MNTMMRILLMGAMVSGSIVAMNESSKQQPSLKDYIGAGKPSSRVSVAAKADIINAYFEPVVYPAPQKFVPDEEEVISQESSERSSPALSDNSANSDTSATSGTNSDVDDEEPQIKQDADVVLMCPKVLFHQAYVTKVVAQEKQTSSAKQNLNDDDGLIFEMDDVVAAPKKAIVEPKRKLKSLARITAKQSSSPGLQPQQLARIYAKGRFGEQSRSL